VRTLPPIENNVRTPRRRSPPRGGSHFLTRVAACLATLKALSAAPVAHASQSGASDRREPVRAVALATPLRLDGRLDEEIYSKVEPASDFVQQEPVEDAPATEKTEVWIFFDKDSLFLAFRCWETRPEMLIANEMRRDSNNIFSNDHVAFFLDTFHDGRNGIEFAINALGGRWDGQTSNETSFNADWNPISEIRTARFDRGWTVEVVIPFKSLRYAPGASQTWGLNVRRYSKWKNETSFLTPVPRALGQLGLFHASLATTLVGLEAPSSSRNLEIKPYAVSSLTTDLGATPRISNDLTGDVGLDVKYGLTQGLTADFTYNTDFAQVEADEQQINLTRFSLFFPEKREFFLENQGLFNFGGVSTTNSSPDTPILFYSRRIGLEQGHTVPIVAGGRVTGRAGRFSLGLLNIESRQDAVSGAAKTNFSVARLKRDILRRSGVGVLFTGRSVGEGGAGANQAYGVDGTFAFFDNLSINTYWARTHTDGVADDDTRDVSYKGELDYAGDRYGAHVERLVVGDHFNPDIGFSRRTDIRRSFGLFRFSPRVPSSKTIRKLSWTGSLAYIENGAGRLDTRNSRGEFAMDLQNSDRFVANFDDTYEFLSRPTQIVGLTIPAGGYDYSSALVGYTFGQQRKLSGTVSAQYGEFYGGHKTSVTISQGRFNVTPQLSLEPTYLGNWVTMPQESSTAHLVGTRATYTASPTMFASAFVQYNTGIHSVSTNVRLRWEYRPGSELFVVYNEQRDTLSPRFPGLMNRGATVKINRLFRF
jgi:Domain of unknown function (DUF5916)